jgi:hypothetical protein
MVCVGYVADVPNYTVTTQKSVVFIVSAVGIYNNILFDLDKNLISSNRKNCVYPS